MNVTIRRDQYIRRCHECKKIFCCVDCRDLHVKKKHPKSGPDADCLLCLSQRLPLSKSKDSDLICHLVIRHLPLVCVLCGQLYRSSSDLENFTKCEYWNTRSHYSRHSLLQESQKKIRNQATPSPIVKTISCPVIFDQKDSPDSEFHSLQSFTSPPELIRTTSTPMHVGVSGQVLNSQFKTPKFPVLVSKTPKTPTTAAVTAVTKNKSTIINLTSSSGETVEENPSPSLFHSATSQLLISKETISDSSTFGSKSLTGGDTPSRSTPAATPNRSLNSREFFRTNSARILEVMEEQEEQISTDMDLTGPQTHGYVISAADTRNPDPSRDLPKKVVRFSDQHQVMVAESTVDPVSDSEEYYEAPEIPIQEKSIADKKSDAQMMRENEENSDKENIESPEDAKVLKNNQSPTPSQTATSSCVVMMVVVENGSNISTSSLAPLINSSLQKLERNPLTESLGSLTSNISNQLETKPNGIVRSVSSVDTYTTSSTVDYYATEIIPNSTTPAESQPAASSIPPVNGGGGIISAISQAMRYAFRGLPGAGTSKDLTVSLGSQSPSSSSNGSRSNPSNFSTIASSLLRRPGKRSRDPINDAVIAHRRELRSPRYDSGISPVAKRPRSWHRIRGRDPIARMRRDANSVTLANRGVSSETQHFQRASVSAGDAVVPILPSRVHQSTQTD